MIEGPIIYLVIALAGVLCLAVPLVMLAFMKHKSRVQLDHYGKYRGSAPAKSFVCPECLHRSYAPSHIARRWCARCAKSYPEVLKVLKPAE